jgi:mannose-6-phosphate isomerase-like protein (cupin superfamily)
MTPLPSVIEGSGVFSFLSGFWSQTEEEHMEQTKYGKYFITETPPHPDHPESRNKESSLPWCDSLYISEELGGAVEGAYYLETCMVLRTGSLELLSQSHSHPFDEYLVFLGTDPEDHFDLGGEVELWMGDEKHMVTKTCAVFVPKGMPHCPLVVHRVDRPFMFITTGNGLGYEYGDATA